MRPNTLTCCCHCTLFAPPPRLASLFCHRPASLPVLRARSRPFPLFVAAFVPPQSTDAAALALQLLEWPRLCHIVAEFAGTACAKEQLQDFIPPSTQSDSEQLLSKTTAAIHLLALLGSTLDFGGIQSKLVKYCLLRLQKGFVINGLEAAAVAAFLQFVDTIQQDIKMGVANNGDSNDNIMPVVDTIFTMGAQPDVLKEIWKVVDADGVVKDSASPELQKARVQQRMLESKVQELFSNMLQEQEGNASTQELNGRFCIVVSADSEKSFPGLLLQSGSGGSTSYIEPVAAVPLNNKLAEARASVLKAEYEAFHTLSKKLLRHLDNLTLLLHMVIQLDVVVARAKFSLMYEGSRPIFTVSQDASSHAGRTVNQDSESFGSLSAEVKAGKEILLQLRHAYHPLLLHQYREHVRKHRTRAYGIRRDTTVSLPQPIPLDINVFKQTRVVTITGPNTGGKTAGMKTVGLAALMAKSGLYVLAADPAYLPWFDAVFADIGDEQALCQSLSTFSGHIRRINHIKESSTGESLVLLDEVGTGTNPVEGAALGMSILESFARDGSGGARLTFASTHHAELKTLKYSDNRFENASVEFDEATLKPTFRLLWGIPGRSNALNICEKLGVPKPILQAARTLYGVSSAEINQVIMDLEKFKQEFENNLADAEQYLKKVKSLYRSLKKAAEVLQEEVQLLHLSASSTLRQEAHNARSALNGANYKLNTAEHKSFSNMRTSEQAVVTLSTQNSQGADALPKVGQSVYVPRLDKEVKVVQVVSEKKMVVVQSASLQLRLKLSDINV